MNTPLNDALKLLADISNWLNFEPWLAHSEYKDLRVLLEQADIMTRANTQESSAAQGAMGDEQLYELFLDWYRTAPMMKDNDHPMPICFIAGYKAALIAQPSQHNESE